MQKIYTILFRTINSKNLVLLLCFLSSPVLHAEYFGLPNGRIADFNAQPRVSVEAAIATGDFDDVDYQHMGFRLNYRALPNVMLFGDFGSSELANNDDDSFGAGAYYALGQLLFADAGAMKVSYHNIDFGSGGRTGSTSTTSSVNCTNGPTVFVDPFTGAITPNPTVCQTVFTPGISGSAGGGGDISAYTVEFLISGAFADTIANRQANWYASAGVQMFRGNSSSNTEIALGGGVVFPFKSVELYGGAEYIGDFSFGIGARYLVK